MVIGNGLVAKSFIHYLESDDTIIFASGVSNSKESIQREFDREKKLLHNVIINNQEKKLVYFSTFNLYDPIEKYSPYCSHKLRMEAFIKENASRYNIFRLGHVVGRAVNNYTIISYLFSSIKNKKHFSLWRKASRNIIDIDDISKICTYILRNNLFKNETVNICNSKNTSILEIVSIIEQLLGKKGIYEMLDLGAGPGPEGNNEAIQSILNELKIVFDDTYVENVIYKYYMMSTK
ncbi:MAG: hypothetical protein RLZZ546_2124 [Bacteroidota bacterium]